MQDLNQFIAAAEDSWVESGRLFVDGQVVRRHVLGACAAQLGRMGTNGVDFFLETGAFRAGGNAAVLQFPVAWSLLGSNEGAWLSSRLVSMLPREIVHDARAISEWACAMTEGDVERASREWWDLYDVLDGQLEAYARAVVSGSA